MDTYCRDDEQEKFLLYRSNHYGELAYLVPPLFVDTGPLICVKPLYFIINRAVEHIVEEKYINVAESQIAEVDWLDVVEQVIFEDKQ